jgi:hypothetical protein
MISARGPDSASADELGIDVRAPLLRVARQTPRPLHPVSASFGGGEQPRCWPASNPFPSGSLPSGLGMAKPTIPQARDRVEVLWGATCPEWVTSAGSLERLLTGARNGLALRRLRRGVGRVAEQIELTLCVPKTLFELMP